MEDGNKWHYFLLSLKDKLSSPGTPLLDTVFTQPKISTWLLHTGKLALYLRAILPDAPHPAFTWLPNAAPDGRSSAPG